LKLVYHVPRESRQGDSAIILLVQILPRPLDCQNGKNRRTLKLSKSATLAGCVAEKATLTWDLMELLL
jgi:hypothetical protein